MSSAVDAPRRAPFTTLAPGAAAVVPNPLAHRLRVRHRLGPHVYLAESTTPANANSPNFPNSPNSPNANFTNFSTNSQLVLKIGRLVRPWERPSSSATATEEARASAGAWQELRVARQLLASDAHAHVVRTLEAHVHDRLSFLVMEYCDGGDLFAHVTRSPRGFLSPPDALHKLFQVAQGVAFLHARNIAHRDLSLENILLHDGVCKIGDLGLSTRADALANAVVGKTAYAAPEVIQGAWYDPVRADLWSLGVVLFMMLTGSPLVPFASPACAEFRALRVVGVRGVLRAWGLEPQFSAATVDLLARLLEIDPANRMASAQELLNHPAMLAAAAASRQPARDLTRL